MTPTLVRRHHLDPASPPHPDASGHPEAPGRARDWAEIQERMLVPLYEAVYHRLEVGPETRMLGLGCGSGLALLMAATRGAYVAGTEADPQRLALARGRLLPQEEPEGDREQAAHAPGARWLGHAPEQVADRTGPPFNLVTAFDPQAYAPDGPDGLVAALAGAAAVAERGSAVVLAGWGPAERCATTSVLRVASRPGGWRPCGRDDLEELAHRAGLRPDGSGRVACPFGYADMDSAIRGLMSTGLFDAAVAASDRGQVDKELTEALHPHRRQDGTVWMPNVFRYLIARV